MKHWFKFSVDRVPGTVVECIQCDTHRSTAEKLLRSKWPNITFIHYYAAGGDNPPSWFK